MNDLMPSAHDVVAPEGAIEWTPSRGFVDSPEDRFEARAEGDIP